MVGPAHLMTDVVIAQPNLGLDGSVFGNVVWGPKQRIAVAFVESFQRIRDSDGEERVSTHQVSTLTRIGLSWRVWLPRENGVDPDDSDENDARTPIAIRNDRSRRRSFRLYQAFF